MATNLQIDERLLAQALKLGKHKTKREAVNTALEQYVRSKKADGIIKLFGTIDFDPTYDYKKQRKYGAEKALKKGARVTVLVDTPIWSLALRRQRPDPTVTNRLASLLKNNQALLLGLVRLEVLAGLHMPELFARVRDELRALPDHPLSVLHHERAAEFFTMCRSKGVQGSLTDFLICAVSVIDQMPIYTTDKDFEHYAKYLPIRLA